MKLCETHRKEYDAIHGTTSWSSAPRRALCASRRLRGLPLCRSGGADGGHDWGMAQFSIFGRPTVQRVLVHLERGGSATQRPVAVPLSPGSASTNRLIARLVRVGAISCRAARGQQLARALDGAAAGHGLGEARSDRVSRRQRRPSTDAVQRSGTPFTRAERHFPVPARYPSRSMACRSRRLADGESQGIARHSRAHHLSKAV